MYGEVLVTISSVTEDRENIITKGVATKTEPITKNAKKRDAVLCFSLKKAFAILYIDTGSHQSLVEVSSHYVVFMFIFMIIMSYWILVVVDIIEVHPQSFEI